MSISLTFYEQLLGTKMFSSAFLYLHFGFVIFWQNNIDSKTACKMLVRLTLGLNFINVLRTAFTRADSKRVKKESSCQSFLCFRDLRV